ncbi:MAG: ATP-binding protein, partial [Deltaproteobacteria bacterium]|nr:ATP-binding protein [Deltaproteobacteria bacterium]
DGERSLLLIFVDLCPPHLFQSTVKVAERFAAAAPQTGLPPEEKTAYAWLKERIDPFIERAAVSLESFSQEVGLGIRLTFDPTETTQRDGIIHPVVRMEVTWPDYLTTAQAKQAWAVAILNFSSIFRTRSLSRGRTNAQSREVIRFVPLVRYDEPVWKHFLFLMDLYTAILRNEGYVLYRSLPNPGTVSPGTYRREVRPFLRRMVAEYERLAGFASLADSSEEGSSPHSAMAGRVHDVKNQIAIIQARIQQCEAGFKAGKDVDCRFLLPANTLAGLLQQPLWIEKAQEEGVHYDISFDSNVFQELLVPNQKMVLLERIFQNIITNAFKYRQPGLPHLANWLQVRLMHEEGINRIIIEDNGRGMTPEELALWGSGKNWRSAEVRAEGIVGDGTGSTVIRTLTLDLGGRLTITSRKWTEESPGGTRIELEFPDSIFNSTGKKLVTGGLSAAEWEKRFEEWTADPANPNWTAERGIETLNELKSRLNEAPAGKKPWLALSIAFIANRLCHEWSRNYVERKIEAAKEGAHLPDEETLWLEEAIEYGHFFFEEIGPFLEREKMIGPNNETVREAHLDYLRGNLSDALHLLESVTEKNGLLSPEKMMEAIHVARLIRYETAYQNASPGITQKRLGRLIADELGRCKGWALDVLDLPAPRKDTPGARLFQSYVERLDQLTMAAVPLDGSGISSISVAGGTLTAATRPNSQATGGGGSLSARRSRRSRSFSRHMDWRMEARLGSSSLVRDRAWSVR